MKEIKLVTQNADETRAFGEKLGKLAAEGMVFLLDGDLGAGKTTLTQGIARGLGIKRNVTSPTFTILKVYKGRLTLNHIDAYRLEGIEQDLGFEELMNDDGLTVIEWPRFMEDQLPEEYLRISIRLLEEDSRQITVTAHGIQYEEITEALK
ncbi:MAG: tRNA (adenosine(37)-N6)-threonylcarbamoyltransferase complex ATPase subunit type 1 TsaE [Solobacterium sp.]|nr:tRNA (adenosine(37)-N6)-threonylcarbamoyltransferase complex ATPase subunit type 1 TsaE [Solobacterium sp.]